MSETLEVKIGASDAGLASTLQNVKGEITRLEDKIKAGDMSFKELDQTMRKITQTQALENKLKAMGTEAAGSAPKVDGLGKDIKGMGDKSEDAGKKGDLGFGKIAAGAALAGAAVKVGMMAVELATAAATKTIASFGAALDMGGRLNDLADRTGIAVDKVMLLERAFQNSGVGADSLGPVINKMQKAIVDAGDGTSKAAFAFADLGLSLSAIASLSPEEQLRTIGKAIAGVEDPAMRASLSMEIFGKSGGALNQVFANFDGEIETAKLQLGSLPDIMKAGSSQFDRISDNLVVVGGKFIEFAAGIIDKVKPALDAVTTALSMFDAAKAGQELAAFFVGAGEGMKMFQSAVDSFKTGNFTDGFKLAWEAIKTQSMETANSVYTNIVAAFKTAGDFISSQFSSSGPLVALFQDFARLISGYISEKLYLVMAEFMDAIGKSGMAESFRYQAETAAREVQTSLDAIPVHAELTAEKASESMGNIPETFKANMAGVKPLFDTVTQKQEEIVKGTDAIISADEAWEKQAMDRIDKETSASQAAFKDKKANQETLANTTKAEDERLANAEKARQEKLKESAALKREEVNLQIAISNAIADGDTKQAEALKNAKALNATIQDLIKSGMGESEASKMANELARAAREADRVKNSLATKIDKQIDEKQKSDAIDPNGRLQKKAQEQIAAGQYAGARATGEQLANRELDTQLRGTGADRDRRSTSDMIKDYYGEKAPTGLTDKEQKELIRQARDEGQYKDTSKMTDLSKKGLDRFADLKPGESEAGAAPRRMGYPPTEKPGQQGEKGSGGSDQKDSKSGLDSIVQSILDLVKKIEPKLPTAALAA